MSIKRFEALESLDNLFNYCEEIDNSLPENERSGYKMLPDIHKIRRYIIENTRPRGEWRGNTERRNMNTRICKSCGDRSVVGNFCMWCGADMRGGGE